MSAMPPDQSGMMFGSSQSTQSEMGTADQLITDASALSMQMENFVKAHPEMSETMMLMIETFKKGIVQANTQMAQQQSSGPAYG